MWSYAIPCNMHWVLTSNEHNVSRICELHRASQSMKMCHLLLGSIILASGWIVESCYPLKPRPPTTPQPLPSHPPPPGYAKINSESRKMQYYFLASFTVDCLWGEWEAWGTCTVTCQGGMQSSTRAVLQPAQNGGVPCSGNSIREQTCNNRACGVTGK